MKQSILLVLGLYSYCLCAQPIITSAIIPEPGDSIHLIRCNETDPLDAMTGANQTWDFSGLTQQSVMGEYYYNFQIPNDTPHGDRYPTAFLAASTPDTQFVYYTLNGGTLELVGAVAEVPVFGTAFSDYSNNETETVFPMQLGTTWSDEFSGTNVVGGFSAPFSGTASGAADGYGTLILPTGAYNNVVRNRQERTYQLQGAPFMESSTLWIYSVPDTKLWLLSIEEIDGGDQLVYYNDSPQIINHAKEAKASGQIFIHPNPVQAGQSLTIGSETGKVTEVALTDFSGRKITTCKGLEINRFDLPTGLMPGIYYLSLKNHSGHFFEKIIVTE